MDTISGILDGKYSFFLPGLYIIVDETIGKVFNRNVSGTLRAIHFIIKYVVNFKLLLCICFENLPGKIVWDR